MGMTAPEVLHAIHVAAYHDRRVPMPAHVSVAFSRAVQLAREAGVTFRRGQVQVWCYRGRQDEISLCFFRDRFAPIYLNVTRTCSDREWARTILHELAHAYYDPRDEIPMLQREERADAFAERAMAGWRHGGRW